MTTALPPPSPDFWLFNITEQKSFLHFIKVHQVEALNAFAYPEVCILF